MKRFNQISSLGESSTLYNGKIRRKINIHTSINRVLRLAGPRTYPCLSHELIPVTSITHSVVHLEAVSGTDGITSDYTELARGLKQDLV